MRTPPGFASASRRPWRERFGAQLRAWAAIRSEPSPVERAWAVAVCSSPPRARSSSLASPAVAQAEDLFATVGPDFTISLRNAAGLSVTQLDPGPYRIVVDDRSDFHNFHLSGPGVSSPPTSRRSRR